MKRTHPASFFRGGGRRYLLFAALSLLLGLAPLVLVEAGLRVFNVGNPDPRPDPFVAFTETRPLFVPDEAGERYEIDSSRLTFFNPESFAAKKTPGEFRVFCLGGSTVAGRPYGPETSFVGWLELGLRAADPEREWRTVNCGGVSYASYRLLPILDEILGYEPDLLVILTGHNEFLEDRTYEAMKKIPAWIARPYAFASRLRIFSVARDMIARGTDERATLPAEVRARLDFRDGLEKYHRDDEWRDNVIEHFSLNVRKMVRIARANGIPLLLVNPGSNLRDSPPFKTEHMEGLSSEQLERWRSLREEADDRLPDHPRKTEGLLKMAIRIDDRHAATFFELGKVCDALGMTGKALEAYENAREQDVCPLRILAPMNRALIDIARDEGIPMVDVEAILSRQSRDGIPGNDVYVDHVHPTIRSHQLIADALLEELEQRRMIKPTEGWRERRDVAYRSRLESLDDLYYAKGDARLERLRRWAAGRSDFAQDFDPDGDPAYNTRDDIGLEDERR